MMLKCFPTGINRNLNLTCVNKCFRTLPKKWSICAIRYFSLNQFRSWRILFYGNDVFSVESLKTLKKQKELSLITRLEVVTGAATDNPVKQCSLANNITVHQWPYNSSNLENFDLGVVVSFGYLIPNDVISKFPLGMINVHASLLPRWRGASPISHAILHGDAKTGITIMKIQPHRFDIGEIISQIEVPIKDNDSFATLLKQLSVLGASELGKCIENLPDNLKTAKPQSITGVNYAPKISKDMAELNFQTMDASAIYLRERAISYFFPLTTYWFGTQVKLYEVSISSYTSPSECSQPGRIYYSKKFRRIHVECCDKTFITFSKIVISKKSPMNGVDFHNGFLSKISELQWYFKTKE